MNMVTLTIVCKMISFSHTMHSVRQYLDMVRVKKRTLEIDERLHLLPPKVS